MVGRIRERLSQWGSSIRDWNTNRRHLPDIHDNPKFHKAASVITRIGFVSKAVLYGSMGAIAMIVASGTSDDYHVSGPQSTLGVLGATNAGKFFVALLVIGLFCYSGFALMFSIFDFDRLGHHGAFPVLARFGRLFSAGFYAFIGVAGVEVLSSIHSGSTSTELGNSLFSTKIGQAVLCILGVIFCVVCVVYLSYIFKPAKFRRELASERLPPFWFRLFVGIARVGALGRVLFFGAFGVTLINQVAHNLGATINGTSILGLEGVLQSIANASTALLFITGGLLFVYAIWAFILAMFRRLPAHYSEEEALAAVGMRWRARRAEKEMKNIQSRGGVELAGIRSSGGQPNIGAAVMDNNTSQRTFQEGAVAEKNLDDSVEILYAYPINEDGQVRKKKDVTSANRPTSPIDMLRKSAANLKRRASGDKASSPYLEMKKSTPDD